MKKDDKDPKQDIIAKISSDLKVRAEQIHEDPEMSIKDQLIQMDVVLNFFRILEHYDENIFILEEARKKKAAIRRRMRRYSYK